LFVKPLLPGYIVMLIDFHTHTSVSKDSLTSPARLIAVARRKGLDRVVVTDHNSIAGAVAAQTLDPDRIIIGEEIMTTGGEILAAYVTEEVPRGLSPQETIQRLRAQGAFISVSHPFDTWRNGAWKLEELQEIAPLVDAVEIMNARCASVIENQRAAQFAREHHLPGTAGSDAHAAFELGKAHLSLPQFSGADELRMVIPQAQVRGGLSPFWVHFASFYARWRKMVV
jgi:predicted metal-dependent phosphoesterase TrpH